MPTTVTKTVKSSGGDYTSLLAWEAGEQGDLVAADEIRQAECYAFFDDAGDAVMSGWTLDATRYPRIFVATGNQHDGTRGTGYRRQITGFEHNIDVLQDFLRVEGLAIESDNSSGQLGDRGFNIDCGASSDIRISKCYQTVGITNDNAFLRAFNSTGGVKVWNCMSGPPDLVSASRMQQIDIAASGTFYLYNNTIVGHDLGAFSFCIGRSSGTPTIVSKNNVADRGASPDANASAYQMSGATTTGSTNNLSDDTSAPGSNPITSASPVYVDETNGDLHIGASDAVCRDVGVDLSADANIAFSDDIDGTSRPQGSAWDVGSHEFFVAPWPPDGSDNAPEKLCIIQSGLRW